MAKKRRNGYASSGGNPKRRVTKAEATGAIQHEFLAYLKVNGTGIVDVVYDVLDIPDAAQKNVGAAIGGLSRSGRIVKVDHAQTQRGKAHGREVRVWKLAD